MQFLIYRFLTYLIIPFIYPYLLYRKSKGKEDPGRMKERFGYSSQTRQTGPLIWFHAASVGESVSVLTLLNAIMREYPSVNILVTTGTVSSAKVLAGRLPSKVIHQYVPIDIVSAVTRFLNYWQPDVALWVESELWPNLLVETHRTGCKMIQINARISENSYRKWKKYNQLGRMMMNCFSLSLAQSEADKDRLTDIGAKNAKFPGNLKYDAPALPADPEKLGKMAQQVSGRPMWVAASTHAGEEQMIINTHVALVQKFKNLLTIIIPRHPARGSEVAGLIPPQIQYSMRSNKDDVKPETAIYIADTIGELGIFYRISGIVFIGGSLVEHGGQNPLEPARLECAIITGPHIWNFEKIYNEMEQENAVVKIKDEKELTAEIDELLSDDINRLNYTKCAQAFVDKKRGAVQNYMRELMPYLKPLIQDIQ